MISFFIFPLFFSCPITRFGFEPPIHVLPYYQSTSRSTPSSNPTLGCQFSRLPALETSAWIGQHVRLVGWMTLDYGFLSDPAFRAGKSGHSS